MKVITVNGYKHSGKTSVCEAIIRTLTERGYSVGSAKQFYSDGFLIDDDLKNSSYRHRAAGSRLVTARMPKETDIMSLKPFSLEEILAFYDHDFVVLESVRDCYAPRIVTAKTLEDIEPHKKHCFAISGIISNTDIKEYQGIPIINPFDEPDRLTDLVIQTAFEPLPTVENGSCSECGFSCEVMTDRIIDGLSCRSDCPFDRTGINMIFKDNPVMLTQEKKDMINKFLAELIDEDLGKTSIDIRMK